MIPGLKSSSSPLDSGNGSAGNGGSPKRDGGSAISEQENFNKTFYSKKNHNFIKRMNSAYFKFLKLETHFVN